MRYVFMIVAVAVLLSAAAWLKERDSEQFALSESVVPSPESQAERVPAVVPTAAPGAAPSRLSGVMPEALPATQAPKPALLPEGVSPVRETGEITLIGGDFLYEENANLSVTSCLLSGGLSIEDALCRQDTDALYRPDQVRP